jgi:hypothetical protein
MCCSREVFFFCFILLYPVTLTFAQKDPYVCSESGNYTSNSTYRANLNSLLASMSSNTEIDYGFYNFSAGENPDKVNAIALCRGDISTEECRSCVNASSNDLLQYCPNQKEAIIWYKKCTVRYSNKLIFGVMEDSPSLAYYNVQNVSDVEGFNQVLRPLIDRLRNQAASGNSTRKFAAGSAAAPDFQTIYALLMCTPDLDKLECSNCLSWAIGFIPQCCDGKQGGRYIAPSCELRYEIYTFYDPAAEEALPPSPLPLPPPSLPSVPPLPPKQGMILPMSMTCNISWMVKLVDSLFFQNTLQDYESCVHENHQFTFLHKSQYHKLISRLNYNLAILSTHRQHLKIRYLT